MQAFVTSLSTKACKSSCKASTLLQYCFIRHREFLKGIKNKPKAITYRRSSGEQMAMKPYHWAQGDTLTEIVLAVGSKRGNHCYGKKGEETYCSLTSSTYLRYQSQLSSRTHKGDWLPQTLLLQNCFSTESREQHWGCQGVVTHPDTHQALCLCLSCIMPHFWP